MINISKDILTFVDSIKYQNIASAKWGKYVLEHKNICKRRKVVVILQPQTGNDNDAPQAKREHWQRCHRTNRDLDLSFGHTDKTRRHGTIWVSRQYRLLIIYRRRNNGHTEVKTNWTVLRGRFNQTVENRKLYILTAESLILAQDER